MANIAFTEYYVVGQSDDLLRLKQKMDELSASVDGSNNEEANSLDLLIDSLGGDPSLIECRGFWKPSTMRLEEGMLYFEVESKWADPSQWRTFVEKAFHVRMFYYVEQLGERIFMTNDVSGRYFPYRYYFDGSADSPYFSTIKELCEEVEDLTGDPDLNDFEDCASSVSRYLIESNEEGVIISRIDVID